MAENPDPIDTHVGKVMRTIRQNAGLSQNDLAVSIGVRFQQVQKYEAGKNRISASRLKLAADALGVSVSDFFRGLDDDGKTSDLAAILADAEAMETARKIHTLPELARQGLLNIVEMVVAHTV
jgi:transcriptional regulator with XRE-family HTH domain